MPLKTSSSGKNRAVRRCFGSSRLGKDSSLNSNEAQSKIPWIDPRKTPDESTSLVERRDFDRNFHRRSQAEVLDLGSLVETFLRIDV
jgi:hypothetical protein